MSTRSWIVGQLKGDVGAGGIIPLLGTVDGVTAETRIVSAGAIGIPGTPNADIKRPFIVVRANLSGVALSGADRRYPSEPWLIWVHDSPGSYEAHIAPTLARIAALFDRREQIDMGDGQWLIHCAWEGDSPDLFDDALGTGTRYASLRLVTKR